MIFLNPAVLFGLLASSIPILIHLFNLKKLKKIEFSTLAFLKELQKNKIRRIKIKQWILLALRVSIILFIVMAFARPTLRSVQIGGTTSAAKTTAIFILDDTFSMSVVDQKGSYFNQAKEIIKQILSQLQEGDEVGLILISNPGSEQKVTSDFSEFVKTVDRTDLTDVSGYINAAIVKAAQMIGESKNFNKEIYVLSDFQKNKIENDNVNTNVSELLNSGVKLYSIRLSDKTVFNLSIDDLKVNNQIFEKDKTVSFSVTVSNHSNQDVKNGVVSLFINNERASQKSFDVNSGQSIEVEMQATPKVTGFIDIVAEIESDEIQQDNKRFANIFIPDKIPIGMFYENRDDLGFIGIALGTDSSSRYELAKNNINQITSKQLEKYKVIILSTNYLNAGFEQINNFLKNGGGLILFPSSDPEVAKINQFFNRIGLQVNATFVGDIGKTDLKIKFEKSDFNHPVFQNIFQNKEKKNFESPTLNAYYKYAMNGNPIISLLDGSAFLSEFRLGNGKVLLFNVSPVLSWSDFPLKSIFAPLINNSVVYLASLEREKNIYLAGETISVNLKNQNISQIKVIRPDRSEEIVNLEDKPDRSFFPYTNTSIVGNYKFISGKKQFENISVNTDPTESVIEYATQSDFESYLKKIKFNGNYIPIDKESNISEKILQARFGSELWRYFVFLAIILALIEMTIARNVKKELEGLNSSE